MFTASRAFNLEGHSDWPSTFLFCFVLLSSFCLRKDAVHRRFLLLSDEQLIQVHICCHHNNQRTFSEINSPAAAQKRSPSHLSGENSPLLFVFLWRMEARMRSEPEVHLQWRLLYSSLNHSPERRRRRDRFFSVCSRFLHHRQRSRNSWNWNLLNWYQVTLTSSLLTLARKSMTAKEKFYCWHFDLS